MWWLWGILAIILFFFILIQTRIFTTIFYEHKDDQDFLQVEIKFWKFIRIKKEVPLIAVDEEDLSIKTREETDIGKNKKSEKEKSYNPDEIFSQIKKIRDLLQHVFGLHRIIRRFLSKVQVHFLNWDTHLGTSEASMTGMISGGIWTMKGGVVGLVAHHMQLKQQPKIYVTPHFQQKLVYTRLECMISFRVGQAIYAMLQTIRHMQGSFPKWSKETA